MVQKTYVYRAVWLLLFSVLAIAAWDGASAWGACAHEISTPKHCAEKAEHAPNPVAGVAVSRAITVERTSVEPCSHCLTHSPWGPNSAPRAIVVNNFLPAVAAADSDVVAAEFSAPKSPVEVYDHGPPGNGNLRYILNSTFRI
jgi:hypothetical protein